MIKEFAKGHHQDDLDLEEHYLDWFFLSKFGKSSESWRNLTDDQLLTTMTLQIEYEKEKEKRYWDNWVKIMKSGGMR